ncbi:MAG: helix-turn-helix domain-containing protein [Rhodospirillales bacterium]|nr:helix-turn-helix domain-containing protein [Rhodospirillales bacterium]
MNCKNFENISENIDVNVGHSDNIHEQAALLDTWDQEYSQLTRGVFDGSVKSVGNTSLRLFVEDMNRAVFQKGSVGGHRIGFGIPVRTNGKCNLCGDVAKDNDLLVFSGNSGFEFLSPDNFRFYGFEVLALDSHDQKLNDMIQALRERLSHHNRVIELNDGHSSELISFFSSIFGVLEHGVTLSKNMPRTDALNRQVIGTVLDCLEDHGGATTEFTIAADNYWRIVRGIRNLVIENPDCPLSVAELAMELGTSRRTIQNACRKVLGMSPVIFLRALRLSEVRRVMSHVGSVTEAATQWGFWHFSYFARDYKYMFGELPSATLDSARKRRSYT